MQQVFLEKFTVTQLLKKFPAFYGPQSSIAEIHKLPPHDSTLRQINRVHVSSLFLIHFNIILYLCPGLPNGVFPSGLPCTHLSRLTYMLHAPPISFFLQHMHSANKIYFYLGTLRIQTFENSLYGQIFSVDSATYKTLKSHFAWRQTAETWEPADTAQFRWISRSSGQKGTFTFFVGDPKI
jgi:hypothetical protein